MRILKLNKDEIRKNDDLAMICEVGYYIGTQKEIDDYVKKYILNECEYNADNYYVFYVFCKFVVDMFEKSEVSDIYNLLDYNYMRLVYMFLDKFTTEKEENVNLLDKVNKIADKQDKIKNEKENKNIDIILGTYNRIKGLFGRIDESIELLKVGTNRGVFKYCGGSYESKMYKMFSGNAVNHSIGFGCITRSVANGIEKVGVVKLGGGCCGEVGIVYIEGKLYLTESNCFSRLLELNEDTTKEDIIKCKKVYNKLDNFADYCESFCNGIEKFLDRFEKYIEEEI